MPNDKPVVKKTILAGQRVLAVMQEKKSSFCLQEGAGNSGGPQGYYAGRKLAGTQAK